MKKIFYWGYYLLLFVFWLLVGISLLNILLHSLLPSKFPQDIVYILTEHYFLNNNLQQVGYSLGNSEKGFVYFFGIYWQKVLFFVILLPVFYYIITSKKNYKVFYRIGFAIIYIYCGYYYLVGSSLFIL